MRVINDTYKVDSIKNMKRQERGTSSTKFNILGFEQNMPQGKTSQELLNDNECKDQLIKIDKTVYTGVRFRNSTKIYSFYYYFRRKRLLYFASQK